MKTVNLDSLHNAADRSGVDEGIAKNRDRTDGGPCYPPARGVLQRRTVRVTEANRNSGFHQSRTTPLAIATARVAT